MRELGIISDPEQARALADYLLTQDVATKIVNNRDGRSAVWVQREDQVDKARGIYLDFIEKPDDQRFQAANQIAREIRKRAGEIEKQHAKQSRRLIDQLEGPLYQRAPLTYGLMVVCIAIFIADVAFRWLYPSLRFSRIVLTPDGMIRDTGFAMIEHGQVWRLLTPIFLHFGGLHLIFNMMALYVFGPRIELAKGKLKFLIFVVVTGIASNVGQFFEGGGAFGGMSGVLFAMAFYSWTKGQIAPEERLSLSNRNAQLFFAWFILGIVASRIDPAGRSLLLHMANTAHGVGLASGVLLALLRF